MADEKELSPEEKAKKDREEAVKEQDNPPQPYPSPEQLDKIQSGETGVLDTDGGTPAPEGETPEQRTKREADEKAKAEAEKRKAAEAAGPAKYQTR